MCSGRSICSHRAFPLKGIKDLMRVDMPLKAAFADATIEAEQLRNSVKSPQGLLVELLSKFARLSEALFRSCRNNPAIFSLIQVPILSQRP